MFNSSAFYNRIPFNRQFSIEIFFSATLTGGAAVVATLSLETMMTAELSGQATIEADIIRERLMSADLSGFAAMDADMIRERLMSAILAPRAVIRGNISRYHINSIEVQTAFAPGDKIIIDSKRLRVSKNGQIVPYEGDFFDLFPGDNTITYTDTASGRTVQVRITYRDKYV